MGGGNRICSNCLGRFFTVFLADAMPRTIDAAILTYHSISGGAAPLCIAPDVFASQMTWLKQNANVIPLKLLVESLVHGRSLPPRTVALTFDDGFTDFYSEAAPVLRLLGLPAIVFLPADYCGRFASWAPPGEGQPIMSWVQTQELAAQGMSFGSHGMRHLVLTSETDAEISFEMAESKKLIEAKIGREIHFFCYPYGCYDERSRRTAAAYYSGGACSTDLRKLAAVEDRFALPRIDVHYLRSFAIFQSMFTERFRLYLCARGVLRKLNSRIRRAKQEAD